MGRKAKFTEPGFKKKGPGRKARKQGDPVVPKVLGMLLVMLRLEFHPLFKQFSQIMIQFGSINSSCLIVLH